MVAGNLFSWGFDGIAVAPGTCLEEVWPGIVEAMYRVRRAERLSGQTGLLMVKDTTPREPSAAYLERHSYEALEIEPNMVLAIDPAWRNYEDYLAALDAKYRRSAKDQIKKLAASNCVIERVEDVGACRDRLHALYLAVQQNAAVRWVTVRPGYLPALASALGEDFRCTVVRRGEDILGFVTAIRNGSTAIAYYIGFDRAAAESGLPIYLRLLHATITDAIEWGSARLSLGRTALEPKAALGAKPERMTVWVRHQVSAVNWLVRGIVGAVPHAEAPERNPFKMRESEPKACSGIPR